MLKRVARAPVNIYTRAPSKFIPRLQTAARHSSRPDMRQGKMDILLMIRTVRVESADFPCDRRTAFEQLRSHLL
jgi:hypothetical protein